ncbi:MAG: hypothetical protein WKF80_01040 [Thermomicrobiales bacterium]
MKITAIDTAVVAGNFPWVLVRIESDAGVTGLGEAYWGPGSPNWSRRPPSP